MDDREPDFLDAAGSAPPARSVGAILSTLPRPAASGAPAADPPPRCAICRGTGWLRLDAPVGSPNFGRLVACECTLAAQATHRSADLAARSNLAAVASKTFATFDRTVPGTAPAFTAARAFAANPDGWLLLVGGFGSGKTHLAAAIANTQLGYGAPVYFAVAPNLLDQLRAGFTPEGPTPYEEHLELIRTVELLILDDLGAEHGTSWGREKLYQILNSRYMHRRPTVITTNADPDTLDPRIASRLADPDVVVQIVLEAADYRRRAQAVPRPKTPVPLRTRPATSTGRPPGLRPDHSPE